MARKPVMTEAEMARSVDRGKIVNYVVLAILILLLLFAGIRYGMYQYAHTFSPEKWRDHPENRVMLVGDLLEEYRLVGLTRTELEELLGPGEAKESFSGKLQGTQQGDLAVYYLGVEFMNDRWLVFCLENGRVISAVSEITG